MAWLNIVLFWLLHAKLINHLPLDDCFFNTQNQIDEFIWCIILYIIIICTAKANIEERLMNFSPTNFIGEIYSYDIIINRNLLNQFGLSEHLFILAVACKINSSFAPRWYFLTQNQIDCGKWWVCLVDNIVYYYNMHGKSKYCRKTDEFFPDKRLL